MSFRFLMALSCCLVYATTASAGVTFIVDDTDDNKGFKSMSSTSTSCDPSTEHLYNGHCEKNCGITNYFTTDLTKANESKGTIERCEEYGKKGYRYSACRNSGWVQSGEIKEIGGHTYSSECTERSCSLSKKCGDECTISSDKTKITAILGCARWSECRSGDNEYSYTCHECKEGYHGCTDEENGNGIPQVNLCGCHPFSSRPDSSHGTISECKPGENPMKFGYKTCNTGWNNQGYNSDEYGCGECNENKCEGYGSSSPEIEHCDVVSQACYKGNQPRYACNRCKTCYEYNAETGNCEYAFEKFCPYYDEHDNVIGIVFDEETRLVMGLKNYTTTINGIPDVSLWADIKKECKVDPEGSNCVHVTSAGDYYMCEETPSCYEDVEGIKAYNYDDFRDTYYDYYNSCYKECEKNPDITSSECENICHNQAGEQIIPIVSTMLEEESNGKENTNKIVSLAQKTGIEHPAAQYCYDLRTDPNLGGRDWFLPTIGQWAKGLGEIENNSKEYRITIPLDNMRVFHERSIEFNGDGLYESTVSLEDDTVFWSSTEGSFTRTELIDGDNVKVRYENITAWVIHMRDTYGHEDDNTVVIDTRWKNPYWDFYKNSIPGMPVPPGKSAEANNFRTRCFFTAP